MVVGWGWGSLHSYYFLGLHSLLFSIGLYCWAGIPPESYAHSMFRTVLCVFSYSFMFALGIFM